MPAAWRSSDVLASPGAAGEVPGMPGVSGSGLMPGTPLKRSASRDGDCELRCRAAWGRHHPQAHHGALHRAGLPDCLAPCCLAAAVLRMREREREGA